MISTKDTFENYIQSISSKFSHEETSEMGYRADFEILIKKVFESINVRRIDHDAKAQQGNKPDFIVLKNDIPILYLEAKDIGVSLEKVEKSEQMVRYYGYTNLVLTDYVEFRFYRNGLRYEDPIKIADYDLKKRTITPIPENYEHVAKTLVDFTQSYKEPIRSGEHLSKIMGGKAQRIRDNVRQFLSTESDTNAELVRIYETFKKLLVHDLTQNTFADMYAQTLVYGLFVARYYDESPDSFSRREARDLIPASNPLLRHFFDHIVGPDFDKRLGYIVNELCDVFSHADVSELMKEYFKNDSKGEAHRGPDPVIHFYEDFLKEYDPELRKKMGAYYTPLPVVNFIVRSVDYVLRKDFGLSAGLADTSKTTNDTHKVQILDPAVGTGTFISAVIRIIYAQLLKNGQKGRWPTYVHNDLLPRVHGFELMMAPYTIAHLKLSIAFKETGFKYFNRRLGIYLTNSLEESPLQQDLFTAFGLAESIAEESKEASVIKNETPIMVVIGNPPYSGVSSNETTYANSLVEKYKVEPGGKQKLQERKHWLNDDYVKFLALAENMVSKNKEGIVGFITNHGYLDNPTFRGMRWHLMDTFDEIYILDLHGNATKKEVSPDGGKDENVFNIQQGVAILIAVKNNPKRTGLAKVYHSDMWGKRIIKFNQLDNSSIDNIHWVNLSPRLPNFNFIVERSRDIEDEYQKGIGIDELFPENVSGIVTMGDGFAIAVSKEELRNRLKKLQEERPTEMELKNKYSLGKNYAAWLLGNMGRIELEDKKFTHIDYRPFDKKWTYFDNNVLWRWREKIMKNMLAGENISLIASKINRQSSLGYFFVSKEITDFHILDTAGDSTFQFPLYLFKDSGTCTPNLKKEIVDKIEKVVGKLSPEDIFYYIYAVLYSPSYREKYKEFLKKDFPRVPYPKNAKSFKKLVAFGTELCSLHLLESQKVSKFLTTYPVGGSNIVENPIYKDGRVFINKDQYFGKVPDAVWNFWIGGYQPAQKWLKYRKGHELTNEDIEHYQKMIVSLTETDKIMQEIDELYPEVEKDLI